MPKIIWIVFYGVCIIFLSSFRSTRLQEWPLLVWVAQLLLTHRACKASLQTWALHSVLLSHQQKRSHLFPPKTRQPVSVASEDFLHSFQVLLFGWSGLFLTWHSLGTLVAVAGNTECDSPLLKGGLGASFPLGVGSRTG